MCQFCEGNNEFRPYLVILQTEHCLVMANLFPIGDLSFTVLPKRHISSISETTPEEGEDFIRMIKFVVSKIEKLYPNYNVFWNCGKIAGQSIPHLHCHIVTKTQTGGVEIKRMEEKRHKISDEELQKCKQVLL